MIPVVNYERLERLRPPQDTIIPFDANTLCILIILICMLVLYKRYIGVIQSRERRYT